VDTDKIIEELKKEGARLDRAIAALDESGSPKITRKAVVTVRHPATIIDKKRGALTPEGRKRLSLAMKRRWAERRKLDS
jgi:hypothetical protein